ncbi:hypothetical protein [Mycobacterium colombiense]|uniref:hypothetical protein n=1 Tax=Mycobacterium colombiense TaxID=339268 RepID=UPI0010580FEE|nr:hypothetical protein [Mycobacterium colombiense]
MVIKPALAVLLGPIAALAISILMPTLAHADGMFIECPSGRDGIASPVTSCPFADNVRRAYFTQPGNVVIAYSPVTDQDYERTCFPSNANFTNGLKVDAVECVGGNDADVVVW